MDCQRARMVAAGSLLAICVGCFGGDDLALAPVTGIVAYRGTPVTNGQVVFLPQSSTPGVTAVGHIESDGTFVMKTAGRPGAVIGTHRVTVHARRKPTEEEAKKLVVTESLIPEKYSQQNLSPLTYDVKEGKNEYRIELE